MFCCVASAQIFLKYYLTEINTIPICFLHVRRKKRDKLPSLTALPHCYFSGETKLAPGVPGVPPFGKDLLVKLVGRGDFSAAVQ